MVDRPQATILLVDDDEVKRYTVAKILARAGYLIHEAATGTEALRFVAQGPDLIVLDVKLPDMSGFDVCRIIKSNPLTRTIPVLHVSATFVDLEDKVQGLEVGADGYLTDVMEPLELLATVKALLRARKAEQAAELTARQWQLTFDAVSDGVALLDRDGTVAQVNQAFENILGRGRSELVGTELHSLLDFPGNGGLTPFARMLESRQRETAELKHAGLWLQVAIDPIKGHEEPVKGALCIVSDITERKLAEEERLRLLAREHQARLEAENANQAKDQFLAVLSHELRTPLNPVLLSVTAMIERPFPPEEIRPMLETIRDNVELQSRLIDDLLDVMRIVRGKMPLHWGVADSHVLLQRAIEICRSDLQGREFQLVLELSAEDHHVQADAARLQQVFWNLIKNAIKFTKPGGTIGIRTRNEQAASTEEPSLIIEISDTGIGIDPQVMSLIFDPFQQGETSVTRRFGGLGLGLAISRGIVEAHGGLLTASSPGHGLGATFSIRLRTIREASREVMPEQRDGLEKADDAPHLPLRILLVEDEPVTRRLMDRLLGGLGYDVTAAATVSAALEAAEGAEFDLLISDIGLPDQTGLDLIRQLTSDRPIPAIALTGYGMEEDMRRSRDAGFSAHLTKPIDFNKLQSLIRWVMARSAVTPREFE